jgi:Ca-activated chloride channel family protein
MQTRSGRTQVRAASVALALIGCAATHAVELQAPAIAGIGSTVTVTFTGSQNNRDFLTIVPPDAPEGHYGGYEYARSASVELVAPHTPGTFEIRYLGAASPYPTLARRTIELAPVTAMLTVASAVDAGANVEIEWESPGNRGRFARRFRAAELLQQGAYASLWIA